MTDSPDLRALALEQLRHISILQFQGMRRSMAADVPWRDPRQGQGRVLALLKMKPEITQRELTFLMGMSRQALAELLAKLQRQGLVEREPSPEDRRQMMVRLTDAGRAADQQGQTPNATFEGIIDCLDDDEVERLADIFAKIIDHLEAESGEVFEERREMFEELWRIGGEGFPGGFDPRMRRGHPGMRGFDPRMRGGPPGMRYGNPRVRAYDTPSHGFDPREHDGHPWPHEEE